VNTTTTSTSRRKFLRGGCLAAAAAGLTLCGGGALAAAYQPRIDLPAESLGAPGAKGRILVAYATKAGSTAETALRIAETLANSGAAVDVCPAGAAPDPAGYSAVILGSAIRIGNILPEALDFVQNNLTALKAVHFSVFILCMTLAEDSEANRQTVSAYLDPLRALIRPAEEGLFAGMMDLSRLKLYERAMILAMKTPTGDFRDWGKINSWAESAVRS